MEYDIDAPVFSPEYKKQYNSISRFLRLEYLKGIIEVDPVKIEFTSSDILLLFILAFFGYFTRLREFENPSYIVFDEVHFGNFTNFYIRHEYFFDIHPPFVKLTYALFGWLSEYPGDIYFGENVGEPYPDEGYIPLRITPIMFSSLTPCMIYIAVRFAAFSRTASFIAGFMWVCDTSSIAESKFLLTDGPLHFWTAFSMIILNYWLQFKPGTKEYQIWKILTSIACGLAYSCKYTAMSMWIVMCFPEFCQLLVKWDYTLNDVSYSDVCKTLWQCLWPGAIIHLLFWYIHVVDIPFIGPDSFKQDDEGNNKTDWLFPLVNRSNPNETEDMSFVLWWPPVTIRVFGLIMGSHMSNAMNYEPHPFMSQPIDWPLLTDVYVGFHTIDVDREVACVGNLFVYYFGFFSVILCILSYKKECYIRVARFFVAYLCSYLPFFIVPRTMYLYHYLIPLMFACMCCGIAVDVWVPKKWKGFLCFFIIILCFYGYLEFSPIVYGSKQKDLDDRHWMKAWTEGKKGREKFVSNMQKKYEDIENADKAAASEKAKAYAEMSKNGKGRGGLIGYLWKKK